MPTIEGTVPPLRSLHAALEKARLTYWEQPRAALEIAIRLQEEARLTRDNPLHSRALTLQGAVSLHGGDLRGAFALIGEAEPLTGDDLTAQTELASLKAHLHFFAGSYGESLQWAKRAVALSDRAGDPALRLHARRMSCLAFGNVGVEDLEERFLEVLELAIDAGSLWEQAVARNDLGHLYMAREQFDAAEAELAIGMKIAANEDPGSFIKGVLYATRSELRMAQARPDAALADARRAVLHVSSAAREANPYLLGMAVLSEVTALLALGRVEEARTAGERALDRLGDRVPQAASMILTAVAGALRGAGRAEEAYDALARARELEREAMEELSQLQLGLERARLAAAATRRLAAELAEAHAALEQRTEQLERLQDQLRDQADRDWLTGVRNRRFLARENAEGPVSLAVLDLDHFKSVNDRFGHLVGDQVLIRVASILTEHVRGEDVVVRTGGEEFAVVMPDAKSEEAAACCERLRTLIAAEPWDELAADLSVTASIGVASGRDLRDLERIADERLYAAKRAGRDRVVHDLAA